MNCKKLQFTAFSADVIYSFLMADHVTDNAQPPSHMYFIVNVRNHNVRSLDNACFKRLYSELPLQKMDNVLQYYDLNLNRSIMQKN